MAWGRINTNSSSSKNDVSYFTKLNEIDYTNDTASMPSRFLFVKNNEELYFIDSSNIIKILELFIPPISSISIFLILLF